DCAQLLLAVRTEGEEEDQHDRMAALRAERDRLWCDAWSRRDRQGEVRRGLADKRARRGVGGRGDANRHCNEDSDQRDGEYAYAEPGRRGEGSCACHYALRFDHAALCSFFSHALCYSTRMAPRCAHTWYGRGVKLCDAAASLPACAS